MLAFLIAHLKHYQYFWLPILDATFYIQDMYLEK